MSSADIVSMVCGAAASFLLGWLLCLRFNGCSDAIGSKAAYQHSQPEPETTSPPLQRPSPPPGFNAQAYATLEIAVAAAIDEAWMTARPEAIANVSAVAKHLAMQAFRQTLADERNRVK